MGVTLRFGEEGKGIGLGWGWGLGLGLGWGWVGGEGDKGCAVGGGETVVRIEEGKRRDLGKGLDLKEEKKWAEIGLLLWWF